MESIQSTNKEIMQTNDAFDLVYVNLYGASKYNEVGFVNGRGNTIRIGNPINKAANAVVKELKRLCKSKYKEFSISGLISYLSDEDNMFLSYEEKRIDPNANYYSR